MNRLGATLPTNVPVLPPSVRRPPPANRPPGSRPVRGRHSPSTARIQARLEKWELDHLRALAAEQAERIEQLEARAEQLQNQVYAADGRADIWHDAHNRLEEHLDDGTEDARCIGLTQQGDLLVVRTGGDAMSAPYYVTARSVARPGFYYWAVLVKGWGSLDGWAVVDDFGNLVAVPS